MTAAEDAFNRFVEEVIRPVSGAIVETSPDFGVRLNIVNALGSSTYQWADEAEFLFGRADAFRRDSIFDIAEFCLRLSMKCGRRSRTDFLWERISVYSGCKSPEELLLRMEVLG